jgi:signal transduction histidine kinase
MPPLQGLPYLLAPLLGGLLALALAGAAWRYRSRPTATPFFALMLAVGLWSLAYSIQLTQDAFPAQLFWQRVGITIGATVPTIWIVLTLQYSSRTEWLTRGVIGALTIDPLAISALAWTNEHHTLVWTEATLRTATEPVVIDLSFAPVYFFHLGYAYLLILVGVALLLDVFLKSSRIYRRQAGLLVVGAVVPLSANVLFTLGVSPVEGLDLTTSTFVVTGVIFATALFRYDLLDITPVAHEHLIDDLGDGVVIVDPEDRIVDVNDNAQAILDESVEVGAGIDGLLTWADVDSLEALDGSILPVERAEERRFYEFRHVPLYDYRDDLAGQVVAIRDVTDLKAYQERLQVSNRLLRHNLRNSLMTVLNRAIHLEEQLDGEPAEHADAIVRQAEDLADLSDKASAIDATLEFEGEAETVDIVETVQKAVSDVRERDFDCEVSITTPAECSITIPNERLLESAVANVVENDGETVEVRVADNGPGIPPQEYEVLEAGQETALEHGSGLGLWLVHWVTRRFGGDLSFRRNDPRGTVVTMEFEAE